MMAFLPWSKVLLLFALPYLCLQENINNNKEQIIFYYNNTYKYDVTYTLYVNKSTEYILEFAGDPEPIDTPARVTVASDFANRTYPLFITARQQKGVFSWQLPMLVQTPVSLEQFTNISRTLCPHNNLFSEDEDTCDISSPNTPIVHLTSSSPDSIKVTIMVETVSDFYITLNSTTKLNSTPSQPKYYFYPFDQPNKSGMYHNLKMENPLDSNLEQENDPSGDSNIERSMDLSYQHAKRKYMCNSDMSYMEKMLLDNYFDASDLRQAYGWFSRPKSVIVMIESDDDICAVVSIQNFSCPVFDNERDILYDGYYLTMTRRGGITLTQDTFPLGFYIVFIVKTSDEDCMDKTSNTTLPKMAQYLGWGEQEVVQVATNDGRVKQFSFRIIQTISYQEYLIAAGVVLAFFGSFYVAFIIAIFCRKRQPLEMDEEILTSPSIPHDVTTVETDPVDTARRRQITVMNSSGESSSHQCYVSDGDDRRRDNGSSSSDTESDFSTLDDINTDKDVYRLGGSCCQSVKS